MTLLMFAGCLPDERLCVKAGAYRTTFVSLTTIGHINDLTFLNKSMLNSQNQIFILFSHTHRVFHGLPEISFGILLLQIPPWNSGTVS